MQFLFLLVFCVLLKRIVGVNHWVLRNDQIMPKIDSSFYMRDPGNLLAFLDQIRNNDIVEHSYLDLIRQHEQIVEKIRFSVRFGEDLVDQAKCAMDFYLMEKHISYLKVTPAYLKRLSLPINTDLAQIPLSAAEPVCTDFAPPSTSEANGPCCYDHLQSFQPAIIKLLRIEREGDINLGKPGFATELVRKLALEGLASNPHSWKFHTIASYYWRMLGDAQKALQCARTGTQLAPRDFKDIPLLSLGTVLFRAGRLDDADVILTAAVDHAPDIAENHFALGSALAMKHDFIRALYHFDEAEHLDPSLLPRTQPVRTFIGCLDNLNKKTTKMQNYVEHMKKEVEEFKKLKQEVVQQHEILIQQQVPLGARQLDPKLIEKDLSGRSQYCSTRTKTPSGEPVLICDFYSDLQMRLQSKDVDIDFLERELKLTNEAVLKQVSTELKKQMAVEQEEAMKIKESA